MEKLGPDMLRAYADVLEDKRRMANVENCRRCPELDQQLLLALNEATGRNSRWKNGFPNAGTIANWLRERLIEVSTSDKQSAILGLFFTTIDPLKREPNDSIKRRPKIAIGIFPLYAGEVKYTIRPYIENYLWESNGEAKITQESITGKDPLRVHNPEGPDFMYFKKSPFKSDNPYRIEWSDYNQLYYPEYDSLSLEENLISHALWGLNTYKVYPELFKKTGFASFINTHCSDPRYMELHVAFTQSQQTKKYL